MGMARVALSYNAKKFLKPVSDDLWSRPVEVPTRSRMVHSAFQTFADIIIKCNMPHLPRPATKNPQAVHEFT